MPALFIATRDEAPAELDGRALFGHLDLLDDLARQHAVTPLSELVGTDLVDENGLAEELELPDYEPQDTQWHSAATGLQTVRTLLQLTALLPDDVSSELREAETILSHLSERGQPFTFTYDL
ncbi:hypothetical protein GCM10008955_35300 [Deinococcus malanensis]|uniref:Uncharacterized protein n=1 Tax=Deinococcus malanensis TaxID=1706855 RepID=A0ABQ2F3G0_9DEIO|nr:hypothetical protein [Deinococcus malanensis]GGK38343.1 hypothetical protein GCM10008955_35300 [Deinococcus malanensis]